jgi:hypothetical protein
MSDNLTKMGVIDAILRERGFQDRKFPEANPSSARGSDDYSISPAEWRLLCLGSAFGTACRSVLEEWPENAPVTQAKRVAILGEEMGEVCDAFIEGDYREVTRELLQVVTVGFAWLEACPADHLDGFREGEQHAEGSLYRLDSASA